MFWTKSFEIPPELVVNRERPPHFGYEGLKLRKDVAEWCAENKIGYRIQATAIMGRILLGPFYMKVRTKKKAAFFKLWWF